jgi:hypothetical protein
MWVPPEDVDPIQLLAPTRKSVSLFGAVNMRTGQLITQFEKKFDAMTFYRFLEKLIKHRSRGRRMVVILDNARYHHASLLKPFLKKHRKRLTLNSFRLIARIRIQRTCLVNYGRLCTHNEYFPSQIYKPQF